MKESCYDGSHGALRHYRDVGVGARVAEAAPHELIQMMLDGALARVAAAKGAMLAGETARKGELIGRVIAIVQDGLLASLDRRGGELAVNLAALYEYMGRRLVHANLHNDPDALDEVASLLRELQSAWRAIGGVLADEGALAGADHGRS
ncbi:MAG TPA: flagellar export chaperone FliS [Gammaproteobacteria bacterium]